MPENPQPQSPEQKRLEAAHGKSSNKSDKEKDGWDIAAILSQIVSGSVIAVVGILVTVKIGQATAAQGKATLEATNRQIASDFLSKLTENSGQARANLLNTIDIAMPVDTAMAMSVRFAGPVTETSSIERDEVKENDKAEQENADAHSAALRALGRLKGKNGSTLEQIVETGNFPDADIAAGVLGHTTTPYLRLSEVDDEAHIFFNKKELKTYFFGADSGWFPLTPYLMKGSNDLDIKVSNGPKGGSGVRLQLRLGTEQYDRRVECKQCANNEESFELHSNIQMDDQGYTHLTTQDVSPH